MISPGIRAEGEKPPQANGSTKPTALDVTGFSLASRQDEDDEMSEKEEEEWDKLVDQVETGADSNLPRTLRWKSTQTMIPAAYSYQMPILVESERSTLSYEFSTEGFDINFSVKLIDRDGDSVDLLPTKRYEASNSAVVGRHVVEGTGTLLLCWDNSYSWFNEKKLAYNVELALPVNKDEDEARSKRAAAALSDRATAIRQADKTKTMLDNALKLLHESIEGLERQIQELQTELKQKQDHTRNAETQKKQLTTQIRKWRRQVKGLGFLSLNRTLTAKVLSYGTARELARWKPVSRKWNQCITTLENAEDSNDV